MGVVSSRHRDYAYDIWNFQPPSLQKRLWPVSMTPATSFFIGYRIVYNSLGFGSSARSYRLGRAGQRLVAAGLPSQVVTSLGVLADLGSQGRPDLREHQSQTPRLVYAPHFVAVRTALATLGGSRCGVFKVSSALGGCALWAAGTRPQDTPTFRSGFLEDPTAIPLPLDNKRRALAHCVLRHLSPAGLGTAAYCRMGCMAPFATTRGGYRLHTPHAAAAFGRHQPCWAKPNMAHGHLCPSLLGLVAPRTQGSNCALTPYGESGLAFGFGSFVGYRVVVGKHIFPTPICCSVGSGVAAATSQPTWGLSLSWTAVRFITLRAPYFAATRRGAIRAVARPSRAPLPYPASVTRGPGRTPSLRFAPAVVVGGKGERCPALGGGAFLSAAALGHSCGYGGLVPPASVLWAKTPFVNFGGFCPQPVRCVLPSVARSRIFAPRLTRRSLDEVGGLSN